MYTRQPRTRSQALRTVNRSLTHQHRPLIWATLFVMAVWGISGLSGCTKKPKSGGVESNGGTLDMPNSRPLASLTPMEAMGLMRNDFAIIVDVRDKAAMSAGMVKGAASMPLTEIESGSDAYIAWVGGLSSEKQVIFYGADEAQGKKAAQIVSQKGFNTSYLQSYLAWIQLKLPAVKPGSPESEAAPPAAEPPRSQ